MLLILYVCLPIGIIYLTGKSKLANRIGSVIIAYGVGLILSHSGIIPKASGELKNQLHQSESQMNEQTLSNADKAYVKIYRWQETLSSLSIALALPLLLFSLNVKQWFKMAGKTFVSLAIAIVSVFIVIMAAFYWFEADYSWKIGGMLVGLYTGGTPNLASLKIMLGLDAETYLLLHTYDMVVSFFYLVFLMTIGKWLFRKFLTRNQGVMDDHNSTWANNGYNGFFNKKNLLPLSMAFGLDILILLLAGSITLLTPKNMDPVIAILTITSLGILLSFNKKINNFPKTFELGMYFILMFSIVIASMVNIHTLLHINYELLRLVSVVVFGTLIMHLLLSKIFKVDADTVMITSAALICSPPFVPLVAESLKNKQIIVGGLTIGIIGYAIGNYLGGAVSLLLKSF
ncbi:MAG: DUF819 family protein [Bacteroidetes bacterium]|nr:DUF819 family protein [Bacteroidota bacterium]